MTDTTKTPTPNTNTNTPTPSINTNTPSMGPIKFAKTALGAVANIGVTALEGGNVTCRVFQSWIRRCEAEQSAMYDRRLKADILSAEDELAQEISELLSRRAGVVNTLKELDNITL